MARNMLDNNDQAHIDQDFERRTCNPHLYRPKWRTASTTLPLGSWPGLKPERRLGRNPCLLIMLRWAQSLCNQRHRLSKVYLARMDDVLCASGLCTTGRIVLRKRFGEQRWPRSIRKCNICVASPCGTKATVSPLSMAPPFLFPTPCFVMVNLRRDARSDAPWDTHQTRSPSVMGASAWRSRGRPHRGQ